MGLKKHVTLGNGVQLNYHRVVSVGIITNVQNVIEVASYTSQAKRKEEQAMLAALAAGDGGAACDALIETRMFTAPYDQDMTVSAAYSWLKGNAGFGDASDVMEEDGVPEGGEDE